jgi:transcriptional regulator EpsA
MMPAQPVSLDAYDLERLAATLDGAIRIRNRCEFYLWTQGALQSFLPHDTLLCLPCGGGEERGVELFSRNVVDRAAEASLRACASQLRSEILLHWSHQGRRPCAQAGVEALYGGPPGGHSLVHGADPEGGVPAFLFIFLGMPAAPTVREHYLAELLLPHLFLAFVGLPGEKLSVEPVTRLSHRQAQVLEGVRRGKTNSEIALALGLSPLTVKNHVQQALRKLAVANRAEAAAVTSIGLVNGVAGCA